MQGNCGVRILPALVPYHDVDFRRFVVTGAATEKGKCLSYQDARDRGGQISDWNFPDLPVA